MIFFLTQQHFALSDQILPDVECGIDMIRMLYLNKQHETHEPNHLTKILVKKTCFCDEFSSFDPPEMCAVLSFEGK